MLCNTCKQKSNCLPAALAANDTRLYALLEGLKGCDRHQTAPQSAAQPPMPRRQLLQLFTRHPA